MFVSDVHPMLERLFVHMVPTYLHTELGQLMLEVTHICYLIACSSLVSSYIVPTLIELNVKGVASAKKWTMHFNIRQVNINQKGSI